jgi:hypothetical protein
MSAYSAVYGIDYAKGADFFADTATHTGRWCAIQFTSNTQVDAVSSNWPNGGIAGHQFDAGTIVYGVFTSIKLGSGHCAAYRL